MTQALRIQKDKHIEPFSRDVLMLSIHDSLRHRKTASADATALTRTIITHLLPYIHEASLQREEIVAIAHEVLNRFDKVAATHYKAFHPLA